MIDSINSMLRNIAPPIIMKLYNILGKNAIKFRGTYPSWEMAETHAHGYDSKNILDKVYNSMIKVRNGYAAYERDSVLFYKKDYPFSLLAALLHTAIADSNVLKVLDFGGSLGSTYFSCRDFLSGLNEFKWCVVERKDYVERGKSHFETNELLFYDDINICCEHIRPNAAIMSSVLQYIKKPYDLLKSIIDKDIRTIVIDRTPFSDYQVDFVSVQSAPAIYKANFPLWIFNEDRLLRVLTDKYNIIAEFPAVDGTMYHPKTLIKFKGYIFTKINSNGC